jgi:predicted small secreted protein
MMHYALVFFVVALVGSSLTLSACSKPEGTAQKAGRKLDEARDKVSDAVDPKGPVEKAGRAIDRATGQH